MKVLSIKQPWAYFIISNQKDIENRTWSTKFRGHFMVHAAKSLDTSAPLHLLHMYERACMYKDPGTQRGGIIGSVELTGVVSESESKWFEGPFGFVLRNPEPLEFEPMRGQLGFFNYKGKK